MATGNEQFIINKMTPMTTEEARKALTKGEFGPTSSEDYRFACSLLARKESDLHEAAELETLTISRRALEASEKANSEARDANSVARKALRNSKWANIIAIAAIVIAIIVALLTKN